MALDRRELLDDPVQSMQVALEGWQSGIWTALPAIVQSFNPALSTAEVQPSLQALETLVSGTQRWVNLPKLVDGPVLFPGGGGYRLTFPLAPGDEVLVVFSSRCIDGWWSQGGIQQQLEFRMHDLSDGFVLPMPMSRPRALAEAPVSMDGVELRNAAQDLRVKLLDSGDAEVVAPGNVQVDAGGDVVVTAGGEANLTGGTGITLSGPRVDINGPLYINGQPYLGHTHTNVTNGPNNTGGVTP